jgi:hypothetical protein
MVAFEAFVRLAVRHFSSGPFPDFEELTISLLEFWDD